MDDHRLELDGFAEEVDNRLLDMDGHLAEMDDTEACLPENPEVFYLALRAALERMSAYGEPMNPETVIH